MPLASLSCPTQTAASSDNHLRCSEPRFFKGPRGLNIHIAKKHRSCHTQPSSFILSQLNVSVPSPSQLPNNTRSDVPFHRILSDLKNSRPVLKRIPRGARVSVSKSLSDTIRAVVSDNSVCNWEHLLTFTFKVLHINTNQNHSQK